MTFRKSLALCLGISFISAGIAKEGMFTPEQLPLIAQDLQNTGLEVQADTLSSLTAFPMGAIVDLANCSASFVSKQGLVVTNHHCARGSVQYNSTAENNYLENGFIANSLEEELPAAPGTRVLVTVGFSDVTEQVLKDVLKLSGKQRFDAIETNQKGIIAQCEQDEGHRCEVASFFGGKEYKLIKQLEIKDVRIVYSPADSVGKYGGDIDNWMWPRHTGDFAFYRAYVDKQGNPSEFSEDNVPFVPEHFLKVSAAPLKEGDFVMAAGYPGSTNRYERLSSVRYVFDWLYPNYIDLVGDWIKVIESSAPEGSDARVKYENTLAGLNNFLKNTEGQISGAKRVNLVERRADRENKLNRWLNSSRSNRDLSAAIVELDTLLAQQADMNKQQFWYRNAKRSQLLSAAVTLYKYAVEREKPNAEREPGYQQRDAERLQESMMRIDRRFDVDVDQAVWEHFIARYLEQDSQQRVAAFDKALGLNRIASDLSATLDNMYKKTRLMDVDQRLAWLKASKAELADSDDPFIQLAVAIYDNDKALQDMSEQMEGTELALQPQYMQAIIEWQASQGQIAYPDANSTLRVTYGNVLGGSPKDGLIYEPFTRIEGISQKDTGEVPFNSPQKQLDVISSKTYGDYRDPILGTVPVNFLSDLDSTGGNSGSATLNAKAELVGLLFDGTIESVNSDWDFDTRTTRTIHVDTRYMLWVMEYVDNAKRLIEEMEIVK